MFKIYLLHILLFFACILVLCSSCHNKSTIIEDDIFAIKDTSMIHTIFIADRYGNTVTLEKKEKKWTVNNKYKARNSSVSVLLNAIYSIRIQRPVPLSSFDNVIKDMSSIGVKVEIYTESNTKVYTIGYPTSDYLGTHMLLDGDSEPYIVHIPYFNGYVSPQYGIQGQQVDENRWRSHKIFDFEDDKINYISLKYYDNINKSFTIDLNIDTILSDINGNLFDFNSYYLNMYCQQLNNINCEAFKYNVSSIDFSKPLHEIIVNNDTLRTYKFHQNHIIDQTHNTNVSRMYANINNGELMLIQDYVFNKVLITLDELTD
tara:strand:+ start:1174 stop:2124 length:951 start_codon:yes stop_codon:yes gene_type:complete